MKHPDRIFTEAEMKRLLRTVRERARRGTMLDRVDHALITFLWATGCRASEVASMSIDRTQPNHLDLESGSVIIRNAKWDSQGVIPLDARSLRTLRWFVREIRPLIRNAEILDRLFITKTGSVYSPPNKMSKKISMLLTRCGFPTKTAHSLRHHFCSDLFRRGAKLHEVQAMMRHRDVRSTMVYSHVTVEELRSAVNRRIG